MSRFYNRTQYRFLQDRLPECFIEVDEVIDSHHGGMDEMLASRELALAENVCRRMADIDFYADQIMKSLEEEDPYRASINCASLVVAHLSSCKSLLDACAITLTHLHSLELSSKQQDLSKAKFWRELRARTQAAVDAYWQYRWLVDDVVDWRDSAVHRITPLVLPEFPSTTDRISRDQMQIRMVSSLDVDLPQLISEGQALVWMSPLLLHERWRDHFVALCADLCRDIQVALEKGHQGISP